MLTINPQSKQPLYIQIMEEVQRLIATGDLAADDMLPSVRQLAADLQINHNTIAQAYRELEREGLTYTRRGQGTFVACVTDSAVEKREVVEQIARTALESARRAGITPLALVQAIATFASAQPQTAKVTVE